LGAATQDFMSNSSPTIASVVSQHLEEASSLRAVRSFLVRAPQIRLPQLGRADERLLAHFDGLSVAGDQGFEWAQAGLTAPGLGSAFVLAVLCLERRDTAQLDRLQAANEDERDSSRALVSALGWVSAASLRGLISTLLNAPQASKRWLGIAACGAHRVDPGPALTAALRQEEPKLLALALRTAARVGRADLLPDILHRLAHPHPAVQLAAAASAVLLGERGPAYNALQALALAAGEGQIEALRLALLAADPGTARRIVRQLASQGASLRTTIRASAWAGDVQAVPWLIKQMAQESHARAAGEAFSFLTGADLARLELERPQPEGFESGPSEDPADENVGLDEDEGLPWPDRPRIQAWWQAQAQRFATDVRLLAGAPADTAQCMQVLTHATQRQRQAAALLSSLAQPGRVLFNIAAPAHRQRRLLAAAGATATA
jgi:uncharacterized protein (TIGR02270 family)